MKFVGFRKLAVMVILAVAVVVATHGEKLKMAKPGCPDRCGNLSIPYPFGTTEDCYLNNDDQFFIKCVNQTVALWGNSTNIEITDISLTGGHLTVMQFISLDCYHPNGTRLSYNNPMIQISKFTVSNTANKFVVVGCDTYGYVKGHRRHDGRSYQTGCTPSCVDKSDVESGSCTGLGCCMTSIPKNAWQVNTTLGSFGNYTNVSSFDECGYAFVVEESSFTFSPEMLTSLSKVEKLPMVVDWAIVVEDDGINSQTRKGLANPSPNHHDRSACKSANSVPYDPDNGSGYRCNCTQGYQGNPYLDHGCRDIDECEKRLHNCTKLEYCVNKNGSFECRCPKGYNGDGRREGKGCTRLEPPVFKLAAGVSFCVIVVLLSSCWLYFFLQNIRLVKMRQYYFHQNGGMLLQQKLQGRERDPDSAKIYTEFELKKATKNFHNSMIIGEGGFGTVYKGYLQGDGYVAIKKAKQVLKRIDQFTNEVIVLSKIKHKNVVKLLGCCLETEFPLLVYEFVSNGTLSQHVHNKAKARLLSWETRLRIAQDVARVLSYLHSDAASTPIIHRDVKCANILLDHCFTAKVADFGASRLVPLDPSEMSTMVQGTFGYLDPEYMQTNQLNEKSDVYSFGVVLCELLTGMTALSYNRPEEERNLANLFVTKQSCLFEILDENVVREGNEDEVRKVCVLVRSCLKVSGENRPSMKEVAMELEGVKIGGRHSWNSTDCVEQESFLGNNGQGFDGLNNGGGTSSSVAFDSLRDQMILHGGR